MKLIAAVMIIGTLGCAKKPDSKPFVIAVVGSGVPVTGEAVGTSRFLLNRSQGVAMWDGARLAYDSAAAAAVLHNPDSVLLVPYNDGGFEDRADSIAKVIRKDPQVIAVIGHATSATTRAALAAYVAAGIPVIMPIATSSDVMLPAGSGNARRKVNELPPIRWTPS